MFLETMLTYKQEEIAQKKRVLPLEELKRQENLWAGRKVSLKEALAGKGVSLIAEIKKASPAKGVLRQDFAPLQMAACYEENGAAAISVLTEERFFQGSLAYLKQVKEATRLPVLRKDFIIDPYQLYEAKTYGADAVLLIAAILQEEELSSLLQLAQELELEALVEVHNSSELKKALGAGAEIIGINNRDLRTLQCDLQLTLHLAKQVPASCLLVSESGISSLQQIKQLAAVGVDAVLVGESIVTSVDIGKKVRELSGRRRV
jgi:indole-3-glycerol phosphate synthase